MAARVWRCFVRCDYFAALFYAVILICCQNLGSVSTTDCANQDLCLNDTASTYNHSGGVPENFTHPADEFNYLETCPTNAECSKLAADCVFCNVNASNCIYGTNVTDNFCRAKPGILCVGQVNFSRTVQCKFGYQLQPHEYTCNKTTECKVATAPRERYKTLCTVKDNVSCLGRRRFYKMIDCNWTAGTRWSTALILSITLGGFGVDRFYLGLWREGIGKLFSFGGLGVWTIVDVILIATGYVTPSDGSLYIY